MKLLLFNSVFHDLSVALGFVGLALSKLVWPALLPVHTIIHYGDKTDSIHLLDCRILLMKSLS